MASRLLLRAAGPCWAVGRAQCAAVLAGHHRALAGGAAVPGGGVSPAEESSDERLARGPVPRSPAAHTLSSVGRKSLEKRIARIQLPVEELQALASPTKVDGAWRKPKLSRRAVAELRKLAFDEGLEFPIQRRPLRSPTTRRKGRKHEREKQRRLEEIEVNLEGMDKLVEEHRREVREARQKARQARQFALYPLPPKRTP